MSVSIDAIPAVQRRALEMLGEELPRVLGDKLVALWAYGAMVFPEPPKRLGDVDTHAVIAQGLSETERSAVQAVHDQIARRIGIEWDSWYVLESDARGAKPPVHLLNSQTIDAAWALHRAHWLAGMYVDLHGASPDRVVQIPEWSELQEALLSERRYIERFVTEGRNDADHSAYAVWNGCRIAYSLTTRVVVVSKRRAGAWALATLPTRWHAAIRAAERVYDGEADLEDAALLKTSLSSFVEAIFVMTCSPGE